MQHKLRKKYFNVLLKLYKTGIYVCLKPKPVEENVSNTDKEALIRLSQGDASAFRQIYDRYWPVTYKVAYRYLHAADLAQDIVQEIFSILWYKRAEFTEVRHLDFYLITMTRNLAFRYLKKMAHEEVAGQEFASRQAKVSDTATHALLEDQYEELLKEAVEMLPPQRKRIFHMAKVEGLSHDAIAQKLEISPNTVKNQMVAALQFIRHRLQHHISGILYLVASALQLL